MNSLPIGVFDSGIGGLTVVNAIQKHLPLGCRQKTCHHPRQR